MPFRAAPDHSPSIERAAGRTAYRRRQPTGQRYGSRSASPCATARSMTSRTGRSSRALGLTPHSTCCRGGRATVRAEWSCFRSVLRLSCGPGVRDGPHRGAVPRREPRVGEPQHSSPPGSASSSRPRLGTSTLMNPIAVPRRGRIGHGRRRVGNRLTTRQVDLRQRNRPDSPPRRSSSASPPRSRSSEPVTRTRR